MRDSVERGPAAGVTEARAGTIAPLTWEKEYWNEQWAHTVPVAIRVGHLNGAWNVRFISRSWPETLMRKFDTEDQAKDWAYLQYKNFVSAMIAEARPSAEPGADAALREEVGRLQALLAAPERQAMGFHERHAVLHARATAAKARADAAERDRDAVRAESGRLRTLLADGPGPCIYCGLAAADLAKCASGFPGCGRADDMTPLDDADQAEVDGSGDDPIPDFAAQTVGPAREGESHLPSGEKVPRGVCRDFQQAADAPPATFPPVCQVWETDCVAPDSHAPTRPETDHG